MKAAVVINEETAAAILRAGGIRFSGSELESIAERFDEIARALITDHFANRYDGRKRLRKLPPPQARMRFCGDLEGTWSDLPGVTELPTVIYSRRKKYEGPFVRFAQAFSGCIADYVSSQIGDAPEPLWRGLIKTLRNLERRGGDGLNPASKAFKRYARSELEAEAKKAVAAMPAWTRALARVK